MIFILQVCFDVGLNFEMISMSILVIALRLIELLKLDCYWIICRCLVLQISCLRGMLEIIL